MDRRWEPASLCVPLLILEEGKIMNGVNRVHRIHLHDRAALTNKHMTTRALVPIIVGRRGQVNGANKQSTAVSNT